MTDGKLIDEAIALMKQVDDARVDETREALLARERLTASTMRRAGYSDSEIVAELATCPIRYANRVTCVRACVHG